MTDSSSKLSPQEEYFFELGRFVHQFSSLETLMQIFLTLQTGVGMDVSRACFSGVRIDQAKSFIKRTREAQEKPQSDLLDRIFAQITILTNARNDILHHGASFESLDSATGFVTNAPFVMPGRDYKFPVSPSILRDLCADLGTVKNGMSAVMIQGANLKGAPSAEFWKPFEQSVRAPWRYIPPERSQTHQQRQSAGPKPRAPRAPSQK